MGGLTDDWGKLAAIRKSEHGQDPAPEPKTPQETTSSAQAAKPEPEPTMAPASGPSMTRRSWYASSDAVQELARVVDDIHYTTRVPKHEVVSELFKAAVAAAPRVEKKLSKEK